VGIPVEQCLSRSAQKRGRALPLKASQCRSEYSNYLLASYASAPW